MKNLSKFVLFGITLFFAFYLTKPDTVSAGSQCTSLGGVCTPAKASCSNDTHTIGQSDCPGGTGAGGQKCCVPDVLQTPTEKPSNSGVEPVPGLKFPCDATSNDEFHTLRPYQASPCSDGPKALFCSNKLVIFESFDLSNEPECLSLRKRQTGSFTCDLNYKVNAHNLNITLDESELPIMGNTEDDLDDAQKLNEYASWYLSGIDSTGSTGEATDDQVINFSGPINKLLPQMIQQSERKRTIIRATNQKEYATEDDEGNSIQAVSVEMHDQIAVCGEEFKIFGIAIGQTKPTECYDGDEKIRLSEWSDKYDLSDFNTLINRLGGDVWNKRYPPLPWDDGTVENPSEENPPRPFESQTAYQKAYKEWSGASCVTVPFIDINLCVDNPFVPNKWAKLYPYVPLSSTTDVEGKNYILTGDGPNYVPSSGTEIEGAQHKSYKNALLYLPHMQEVFDLSQLLNKTFRPTGYESEKLPETTESVKKGILVTDPNSLIPLPGNQLATRDPYASLDCSAVNVRINEGDNIFPGDRSNDQELYVEGAEYRITQVECHEVYEPPTLFGCGPEVNGVGILPCRGVWTLDCPAQVGIEFKTGTQTPYANEIFSDTVADSGSTFRKIFPKVEEGAPVECIADIPTATNVTYSIDNPLNQAPAGGEQEFTQTVYPADGANSTTQLTFPHIGSVYEYFLKGIQTALRPKGYGEPIANGNCEPSSSVVCGELPELPKASGSCNLGGVSSRIGDIPDSLKEIVSAAAETYKVQPNLILAIMFGEGAFNQPPYQKYDWTDENVKNWATCEPLPNCSGPQTSIVSGLALNWSSHVNNVFDDLKKIDPNKTKGDIDGCNLIDEIYIIANSLHSGAGGGVDLAGKSCYGITMSSTYPTSCGWNDSQIETAIRQYQFGSYWTPTSTTANVSCPYPGGCNCATLPGSCATGGGVNAGCDKPGDSCEKVGNGGNSSHNACVFGVAKGN